ncbi:MAG TPA: beta-ketoacyl-ACP synthase III [Lacunisphaera sp.]|nr:beta-ketoacyl-ACP synthase III [Lacunisphaera sp.]
MTLRQPGSFYAKISAGGAYVPSRIVPNDKLEQFPKTALPLIEAKTGVKQRHYAGLGEFTSDLGARAAGLCLERAGLPAAEVEMIILATSTPDRPMPATATRIQHLLSATKACAFDLNSVCAGAVYGIGLADAMIRSGQHRNVLVIAAEIYSRILNPADFSTFPYFGDGAGALLLTRTGDEAGPRVLHTLLGSDGSGADVIQIPVGGSMRPYRPGEPPKDCYFTMNGRSVFDFAVGKGIEIIKNTLEATGVDKSRIAHVVVHQANINILRKIAEGIEIPLDRFSINLDRYGNTAAASVMLCLDELLVAGHAKPGDLVVVTAFGGGLSWGCSLIRL